MATRVTQVVYALSMGGSEALARAIARGLNRSGRYACSMYAVDHGGPLADLLTAEGITCRAFSRRGRLDLRLIGRLVRQFRANGTALVHTHHLCQLIYGGIAGRLAGARVVHTEHEFYTLRPARAQRLLRVLSVLTAAVTTVAPAVTEFLQRTVGIPSRKLETIPNGVDIDGFRSAKALDRSVWGYRDEEVLIACIGRLSPEKGHGLLLDAFRLVRLREPRAKLILIGDGAERERLIDQADTGGVEKDVRFLGVRGDIPELLATCDLLVLPSFHEGLPIVMLEAMAAGKPVVATRVGAIPDIVQDGRTGLLVPPGEPRALASALTALIGDEPFRRRLAAQAFDLVRDRFDFDQTLARYEAVYEQVLEKAF